MKESYTRLLETRGSSVDGPVWDADSNIVRCAADLFLQKGIEGVKMVDIAEAANVGVATIYRHFSTKTRIAALAAAQLWDQFNLRLVSLVESDAFLRLNGIGRLRALLEGYCDAYGSHADFVSFVDEFDHIILAGQLSDSELREYDSHIDSFYPIFEDAYLLGLTDGSIVRKIDFRQFYLALAHAIMGVAQKLCRGEVIPSDDFSHGGMELQSIVNMALWSLVSDESVPPTPETARLRG